MGALEQIYARSPIVAQNAMISAYGLLLQWRRRGADHARLLGEVSSWEQLDGKEASRRQGLLLRRAVVHAAASVPYYRELFGRLRLDPERIDSIERLRELPILEKDQVREEPSRFYAQDVRAPLTINTSGTTGAPLSVRCTREALQRNYAHFYRLRAQLGIGARDRCATFAGRTIVPSNAARPPFWRRNWAANSLLFSTYHMAPDHMPAYVERLEQFSPALIDSYPSALGLLASYVRDSGRSIRPRAIITSSETLLPEQRTVAQAVFGCAVTDQYGSAEMVAFIAQCPQGTYHVWPSYGLVEVLVDGRPARAGEVGELVCTGYINEAMPLLRYRTGDLATLAEGCPCHLPYPALERIEGRMDDVIVTPEGRRVGRLDPVFKGVEDDAFRESQIVQETADRVTLRYVRGSRFSEVAVQKVKRELQKRLGGRTTIHMQEVTSLPRSNNGKLKAVVSMLDADTQATRRRQ